MTMRHAVVITSLEEDFAAIGLTRPRRMREDAAPPSDGEDLPPEEESVPGDKESSATFGAPKAKKMGAALPGEAPPEAEDDDSPDAGAIPPAAEDMDPAADPPPDTEDDDPEADKVATEWLHKRLAKFQEAVRAPTRATRYPRTSAAPRRTARTESRAPNSRIEALTEDVNRIVGKIGKVGRRESVRGFANVALIAEMLGRAFSTFGRELNDMAMLKASHAMNRLAEEAADVATAVDADDLTHVDTDSLPIPGEDAASAAEEDPDGQATSAANLKPESVRRVFNNQMQRLTAGLDLYSDLTGDDMTGDAAPPDVEDEDPPPDTEDDLPGDGVPASEDEELPPVPEDEDPPPAEEPPMGEAHGGAHMRRMKTGRQLKMSKILSRASRAGTGRTKR